MAGIMDLVAGIMQHRRNGGGVPKNQEQDVQHAKRQGPGTFGAQPMEYAHAPLQADPQMAALDDLADDDPLTMRGGRY